MDKFIILGEIIMLGEIKFDFRLNITYIKSYYPSFCKDKYAIEISTDTINYIYKFETKQERDEVLAILDKKLGAEVIEC